MTNPNDPAFSGMYHEAHEPTHYHGLTKREKFAKAAMQGLTAGISQFNDQDQNIIVNRPKDIAELSCLYADALIAELNKAES